MNRLDAKIGALLAALAFAGCAGASDPGTDRGGEGLAQSRTPNAVRGLIGNPSCGVSDLVRSDDRAKVDKEALTCLEDTWVRGGAGGLHRELPSFEGDRIDTYYTVRRFGDVIEVVDPTRDRYGSPEWRVRGCLKLRVVGAQIGLSGCSGTITVNENTPSKLLERRTLPYCGRLGPSPSPKQGHPVRACVRRALASGRAFEFERVRSSAPPRQTEIVRFNGNARDAFQIYVEQDTEEWTLVRCIGLDPLSEGDTGRGCDHEVRL